MFYVVSAAHLLQCDDAMPSFHELLRHDPECSGRVLRRVQVQRTTALRGGEVDNICTVAHVWRTQHDPDPDGEQMRALKCFLRSHPQVRWIWMDYSCMPQGKAHCRIRTRAEYVEFQWMLLNMNWLFLGGRVLILLEPEFMLRAWPQLEAWLAMSTGVLGVGIRPAEKGERRHVIVCLAGADAALASRLSARWCDVYTTPRAVLDRLGAADVLRPRGSSSKHTVLRIAAEIAAEVRGGTTLAAPVGRPRYANEPWYFRSRAAKHEARICAELACAATVRADVVLDGVVYAARFADNADEGVCGAGATSVVTRRVRVAAPDAAGAATASVPSLVAVKSGLSWPAGHATTEAALQRLAHAASMRAASAAAESAATPCVARVPAVYASDGTHLAMELVPPSALPLREWLASRDDGPSAPDSASALASPPASPSATRPASLPVRPASRGLPSAERTTLAVCWVVLRKVAGLLDALSPHRFLHRDLLPANVLVRVVREPIRSCADVDVYLVDFGHASALVDGTQLAAKFETVVYNPASDLARLLIGVLQQIIGERLRAAPEAEGVAEGVPDGMAEGVPEGASTCGARQPPAAGGRGVRTRPSDEGKWRREQHTALTEMLLATSMAELASGFLAHAKRHATHAARAAAAPTLPRRSLPPTFDCAPPLPDEPVLEMRGIGESLHDFLLAPLDRQRQLLAGYWQTAVAPCDVFAPLLPRAVIAACPVPDDATAPAALSTHDTQLYPTVE